MHEQKGRTQFSTQASSPAITQDEGGLRPPPHLTGWRKAWWWFDFIILVKLARLRFIAILVVIGVIITQWDTLAAYYDKWTRPSTVSNVSGGDVEWFCPMHPYIIRDNPKEKCPICFMPLSKRKKGEATQEALPAGVVSRVQLSPYRVVLAGVNIWTVDYLPLTKRITTVGYIEFNERAQRNVAARVNGRIDKLIVNETGRMVRTGDVLALLYSPDLVVTVQNLLDAKRANNETNGRSAQRRLELLGIDEQQIEEIVSSGKPETHLKIRSPISGHVIQKYIREGQYVTEGMALYEITDLSTVWVQAQVYEDDLPFLPLNQSHDASSYSDWNVTATTTAFPNEVFKGKISLIYPHVDQSTRTIAVRFELDNPGHKLRPGSTANVTIRVPLNRLSFAQATARQDATREGMLQEGKMLAVPESAVIDTGSQTIVYHQTSPGVFDGVRVALGPRMVGPHGVVFFPVLRGLQAADKVVTAGSFLIDAETRLNPAAGSIYYGGSGGSPKTTPAASVRPSTPEDEGEKIAASLANLSAEDRQIAMSQRFCPVLPRNRLGSMGTPVKLLIHNQAVFLCCDGCRSKALAAPEKTLMAAKKLQLQSAGSERPPVDELEIRKSLTALSKADRQLAERQRYCAVSSNSRLGAMGVPVKVFVKGEAVFLCCEGCTEQALNEPDKTLATAQRLRSRNTPQSETNH